MVRGYIGQWVRIARLHLKDVADMEQHLGMLRRALSVIPSKLRAKSQKSFRTTPVAADTMYVESYDGPTEFTSTRTGFESEDDHHMVEAVPLVRPDPRPQRSPVTEPTPTTPSSVPKPATTAASTTTTRSGFHSDDRWHGIVEAGFFTEPLTLEAMDDMTMVRSRER